MVDCVVSFDLYVRIWLSGESGAVGVGGGQGGRGQEHDKPFSASPKIHVF